VAQTLVGADLDLAADVGGDLATEVTLDLDVRLEVVAEGDQLGVGQVADARVRVDTRRGQGLLGAGTTHSEDVGESDLDALLAREIHTNKTCHLVCFLCFTGGLEQYRSGLLPEAFLGAPVLGLRAGGDVLGCVDDAALRGRVLRSIHLSALLEEMRVVLGESRTRASGGAGQPWRCLWRRFSQITMTRP